MAASSSRAWLLGLVALALVGCDRDGGASHDFDVPPGRDAGGDGGGGTSRGLDLDYESLEQGAKPRWDPSSSDWTGLPWPSDARRGDDGGVDLTRFPDPGSTSLLGRYVELAMAELDGWGLNGSVYFEVDGAIDPSSLPSPEASMNDPKAAVQLVNVSSSSPGYGEQVPLRFDFEADGGPYLREDTLALRPVFGHPLAEGTTYCALLTRAVLDDEGRHLAPPAAFRTALDEAGWLEPLRAWLPDSGLVAEDVAAATCFTTQRATRGLRRVRSFLEDRPAPTIDDVGYAGSVQEGGWYEFRGTYAAPNFQKGDKPYDESGGDIRFDDAGEPVVQLQEPIRFRLTVPISFSMPDDGWPVVLYAHGTTGDWTSCNAVAEEVSAEGLAMLCIDQPLHGDRGDESWDDIVVSFNVFNPAAGRTNFRQSAIDTMTLSRMVKAGRFDLDADRTGFGEALRFDPDQIWFFGHSHGGISGAIALGLEPNVQGAVLSGAGGVFIESVLRRKDIIDFEQAVAGIFGVQPETLDSFHPTLSLVQMLTDATDPINFARGWLEPGPGGQPKHVLMTEGTNDQATPSPTTEYLAAAAGVPLIEPVAHETPAHGLRGLPFEELPVLGNVTTSTGAVRTVGLRQWEGGSHFVAFQRPLARSLWRSFLRSGWKSDADEAPVIDD